MLVFKHHRRNNGQRYGRRPPESDEDEDDDDVQVENENDKLQPTGVKRKRTEKRSAENLKKKIQQNV